MPRTFLIIRCDTGINATAVARVMINNSRLIKLLRAIGTEDSR